MDSDASPLSKRMVTELQEAQMKLHDMTYERDYLMKAIQREKEMNAELQDRLAGKSTGYSNAKDGNQTSQASLTDVQVVNLELKELRLRYELLESENLELINANEQHEEDREQLESELAVLKQLTAGGNGAAIQVEHVATEINVSTTNTNAESSADDQAISILANTQNPNISHSNFTAAREILNVTMSGDTPMMQGRIDELLAEMKNLKDERNRLQEENKALQEGAEAIFSESTQGNKLQEQQPQVMLRREKVPLIH
ncbi:hypothetical protein FA15DRAFT_700353 [Coprinopsis marcescibilis]|uniref:NUDE domain-containing protein n=1 Tax=Coprinopsis marcescibilis TaxID=230819 RepID=A0A5C3LK95_COPMA|nr:hypothetical protein FA15DRAFT_700353 [Coprinopsis marcescibilis]